MTLNIAHRGFSGKYPENTMRAFREAVECGSDGIELDVHLSKDGEVVIIHDENLKRVSGRAGFVKDHTAAELAELDVSAGFDTSFGKNTIPTLREYFAYIKDTGVITNIELKNTIFRYEGMEEKVVALIKEYGLLDRVLLSSFNHQSMVLCKRLSPETRCSFLVMAHIADAPGYMRAHGMDFLNPHESYLSPGNLEELRQAGVNVQAWTIDCEKRMEELVEAGIFAIITNRPDTLRGILDARRR